jgi:hypothetical protein
MRIRGLSIIAAGVVLFGCAVLSGCAGGADDEPAAPGAGTEIGTDATGVELAAQACASLQPQIAVDDIGAEEMRELSRVYGEANSLVVRAYVDEPENTDISDLLSPLGLSDAGWESAAEIVEAHGEDTTAWDAETTGDFDRLVTRLLGYEAEADAICARLG